MRIDPRLAEARRDGGFVGARDAAAGALAAWRADPAVVPVLQALEAYGRGAALGECPALEALFAGGTAPAIARLTAGSLDLMREQPLAQLNFREFSNGVVHSLTLATSGRAGLSLSLIDAEAWAVEDRRHDRRIAAFTPGDLRTVVLAGTAQALLVSRDGEGLARESQVLAPGTCHALDGERSCLVLTALHSDLVTLRLHRRALTAEQTLEFDLASGALLKRIAGNPEDSRMEALIALLGRMERVDAVPVLANIAAEGTPALRWQAIRETLGLDSAAGVRQLRAIRAGDPLHEPASALLARLIATYPALAMLPEDQPCPA